MSSVTPCCREARQSWKENTIVFKAVALYLHGVYAQTLIGTQMNCVFWSITLFCLLGCLEFFQAQLTKAWRKDSKHHGGEKNLYYRLEWLLVCCQVPRGGCAELMQWQQWALCRYPAFHTDPRQLSFPTLWGEWARCSRATGLRRRKGHSFWEMLCAHHLRFSLSFFSFLLLLVSLPSAPNQKYC